MRSLLSGVIDVEWFRMDSLAVSRLPVSEEKKPETKSPEENIFPPLPRIVLQELEIKPASVDLVFTDIPYIGAFLPEVPDLVRFAEDLTPSTYGFLTKWSL